MTDTGAHSDESPTRRADWDFSLAAVTVGLLAALGAQSLAGTAFAWWAQRADPAWTETGYPGFVGLMNAIATPLVFGLVVAMGLCVPKRLFARRVLIWVSAAMGAAGLVAWAVTGSVSTGLAVYLIAAGAIQAAVAVMVVAGARSLTFVREGRAVRLGSALLHLGFIGLGYVVVALQSSPWMLPAFALVFALCVGGSALTFYARPLPKPTAPEVDASGAKSRDEGPDRS